MLETQNQLRERCNQIVELLNNAIELSKDTNLLSPCYVNYIKQAIIQAPKNLARQEFKDAKAAIKKLNNKSK